jgi:hypothetical protein
MHALHGGALRTALVSITVIRHCHAARLGNDLLLRLQLPRRLRRLRLPHFLQGETLCPCAHLQFRIALQGRLRVPRLGPSNCDERPRILCGFQRVELHTNQLHVLPILLILFAAIVAAVVAHLRHGQHNVGAHVSLLVLVQ